ncbi:Transcription factor TGA9 [Cucurbita argyrosperma subsp. argyrosperma]|nr:Transcription factor TGA9 [Cucurbita argyrosperma subsp. argyrosperma]
MATPPLHATALSNSSPYSNLYGIHHNPSPPPFLNQEHPAFDFGELEEAIVLQGVKLGNDEPKSPHFVSGRPAATLEMFPSWPIRFQQTPTMGEGSKSESTDSGSANINNALTSKTELEMESDSPISRRLCSSAQGFDQVLHHHHHHHHHLQTELEDDALRIDPSSHHNQSPVEGKRKGGGSTSERQLDPKTLRRLAQNREAARKSRLRKKAYIQQLESSRMKLSQLEQDLHRARSQGLFLGACGGVNSLRGAAIFDMEYARWLDDDHRLMAELRAALHGYLPDGDLQAIVDNYISHYDEIFHLKSVAAKSDVFHLITGMWMTPAERCFLWIGGFRPSKLIEMLIPQLETLTDQQAVEICSLQRSSQETEDALYQGLEQLQHSLIRAIAGTAVVDGINHMAAAAGQLSNLEGFIRQADMLRQQTLHQVRRILTIRQAARCFVVIGEYYERLRALSSLWELHERGELVPNNDRATNDSEFAPPFPELLMKYYKA